MTVPPSMECYADRRLSDCFGAAWRGDAAGYTLRMPTDPTPEDGVSWLTANSDALVDEVRQTDDALAEQIRKKIASFGGRDSVSITDMFEMQMLMNKLSQLREMSSSVVSAANSAISSMARNVKA